MKNKIQCLLCSVAVSATASAGVVYVDLADLAIPSSFEGVYINILNGQTSLSFPSDFNDAPWLNLFSGGLGISNSDLLRPLSNQSTASYDPDNGGFFVNVSSGTLIDGSLTTFVSGESASVSHLGVAADQFQSGVKGYLAFEYQSTSVSGTAYGWLSFALNESGDGLSYDLAYSDTPGESLLVGAVPEPASFAEFAGLAGLAFAAGRRRRSA
jgi:hypothetical protein